MELDRFFRDTHDSLLNLASRHTDRHSAEDAVMDFMVKVVEGYRATPRLEHGVDSIEEATKRVGYRAVVNNVVSQHRRRRRVVFLRADGERSEAEVLDLLAGGAGADESDRVLDRVDVEALLARLDEPIRRLCEGIREGRHTRDQIAAQHGMTRTEVYAAVASLLHAPEISGPRAHAAAEQRRAAREKVAANRRRKAADRRSTREIADASADAGGIA